MLSSNHPSMFFLCTGEARTEAMVAAKEKATGVDDNDFDNFVEPASLILSTVIKFMPAAFPDRARLLHKAENLKLPGNPLVSSYRVGLTLATMCMSSTIAQAIMRHLACWPGLCPTCEVIFWCSAQFVSV